MKAYMIGYDLNSPGQDYSGLIDAIKTKFPTYWHHLDSTWIVVTTWSAAEIRDSLAPYLDSGDELFVARLSGEAAWIGFPPSSSTWLKKQLESVSV